MNCDRCGSNDSMPYTCDRCNGVFCPKHRLPESHDCMGLMIEKAEREIKRQEGNSIPWFRKSESSGSNERSSPSSGTRKKTTSEKLDEQRRAKYSSPDVNPDGSMSQPAYDSEISSISRNSSSSTTLGLWKIKLQKAVGKLKRAMFSWVGILVLLSLLVFGASAIGGDVLSDGVDDIERYGSTVSDHSTGGESNDDTQAGSVDDDTDEESSAAYGPGSFDEEEVEDLVLEYVNEERFDDGSPRVEMQHTLRVMARQHSDRMHEHDEMGHEVAGSTTQDRLSRAGCEYGAENVAQSWASEHVVMDDDETIHTIDEDALARALTVAWMKSPSHSSNLRDADWVVTGIGVTIDDDNGMVYATQKFCASA